MLLSSVMFVTIGENIKMSSMHCACQWKKMLEHSRGLGFGNGFGNGNGFGFWLTVEATSETISLGMSTAISDRCIW